MYKLELYLIRHGKTHCNENRLYCGTSDIELSEVGKRELTELKKLSDLNSKEVGSLTGLVDEDVNIFKYPKCEIYYTSGAKRANETFELLYPKVKYEVIKEFWEYNFGDFEMKSYEMLKSDEVYISWIMDKVGKVTGFNGESKLQYRERIGTAFKMFLIRCKSENIKSTVLVSHGGTIGTILEMFYSDEKTFYEWQPQCGLGYKIVVSVDTEDNIIKVESIAKLKEA